MSSFDVWILSFEADAKDPVPALMDAFRIDEGRARRIVESIPCTVKRKVSSDIADRVAELLQRLGAEVAIKPALSSAPIERAQAATFVTVPPATDPQKTAAAKGTALSRARAAAAAESPPSALPREGRRQRTGEIAEAPPARRRSSSAVATSPAARRLSSPTVPAATPAAASSRPPRRIAAPTMPARSLIPIPPEEEDDDEGIAVPFAAGPPGRKPTLALGSPLASRPPTLPAVVGGPAARSRSEPPGPAADEGLPRTSRHPTPELAPVAPTLSRHPTPELAPAVPALLEAPALPLLPPLRDDSELEPPIRETLPQPPRRDPQPPAAQPQPPAAPAPAAAATARMHSAPPRPAPAAAQPGPYLVPALAIALGLAVIFARLWWRQSMFYGTASWYLGVHVDGLALAGFGAGVAQLLRVRAGYTTASFIHTNKRLALLLYPLALAINLLVFWVRPSPRRVSGTVAERISALEAMAAGCRRSADNDQACSRCCGGSSAFTDVCECFVPARCSAGDASAEACAGCCREDIRSSTSFRHYSKEHGCVCNADSSLFE